MRKYLFLYMMLAGSMAYSQPFEIRGVLPWHNFLSGPSAWNLEDYERYLDDCAEKGINFIGFHNYTGGGERYAPYVEPMIKIAYKGLLPAATLDHSLTARWGYLPGKVSDFAFGTSRLFDLPPGAEAFGADVAVLPDTPGEHYEAVQNMMKQVVDMAHERGMQVAMGFEFGVLPPEYFSLNSGSGAFYWRGEANMVPNPAHPLAIKLMQVTIGDILETYPDIDWISLWLNEHSFLGVDVEEALKDTAFQAVYRQHESLFEEASRDETAKFIGVWSLEYIRLAFEYIKRKAPEVKVVIGGWGGGNQLPLILKGLDRGLPGEIVFSLLNPGLGSSPQPDFLKEIAAGRRVWAVPWLEGDHQLWHYQPRVQLMRDHVKLAREQRLDGVIAIHWRTEETRLNFETFARFARDPDDPVSPEALYKGFLEENCGEAAAAKLTGLFLKADTSGWRRQLSSPEYFAYTPRWGRMDEEARARTQELIDAIKGVLSMTGDPGHKENLNWFLQTFRFEKLLDKVGRRIEPARRLKDVFIRSGQDPDVLDPRALAEAKEAFEQAPAEELFATFASKVRSRGELGELSSLNQKLWSEYQELKKFLESME